MRTFRFSYLVAGGATSLSPPYEQLTGAVEYTFPTVLDGVRHDAIVRIRDRKGSEEGVTVHYGFDADVDIFGSDFAEAREAAHARLQFVLTMLVLEGNANVGKVDLLWGQETTVGSPTTEALQIALLDGPLYQRHKQFSHDELQPLIEAVIGADSARVNRAARWYRKGLSEEDAFERFSSYWVGLECLNKPLIDCLGGTPDIRQCPNCGVDYEAPSSKGIRSLFSKHSPNGLEDFKLCRNLRVDIQHGSRNLADIIVNCGPAAEICRVMLRTGIHVVLGLITSGIAPGPEPTYNLFAPWVEFQAVFNVEPENLPPPPLMDIEITGVNVTPEGGRSTSPTFSIRSNYPVQQVTSTVVTEKALNVTVRPGELEETTGLSGMR
jgi:hypothetical protein